jgi:hypothetical protein
VGLRLIKTAARTAFGLFVGYCFYVVLVVVLIVIERANGGFSKADNFFVWLYPLAAPYLLTPSEWKQVPLEENLITLCGGLLLIAGMVWANWKRKPI